VEGTTSEFSSADKGSESSPVSPPNGFVREHDVSTPAPEITAVAEGAGPTPRPPVSLFIGRDWELAQLRAALSETQARRGQFFLVSGEAGIGKSRLVGRLAALAEGEQARVVWGRCWEGEEAPAFWPWIQILRNLVFAMDRNSAGGISDHASPEMSTLIRQLKEFLFADVDAPPHLPSDQARFRFFDAAVTLIKSAAADRPLVLILEDLHEADRSSLLLLDFLARQLHGISVLVLGTYREPEIDFNEEIGHTLGTIVPRAHRMSLSGLRQHESAQFLSQGFEIFISEETLSAIQDATAGNPFFLDELARRLVGERDFLGVLSKGLKVPEGLKAPIRSRVAGLSPDLQALLTLASVIGREFAFELLVEASGLARNAVLDMLAELAALRFVDAAGFGLGPYRFVHSLVRDTIYQDTSAEERWRLHLLVGRAMERLYANDLGRYIDHLAHHFSEGAVLGDLEQAIEYSRQAGARATRQFGYDEAIGHYQRALELAQSAQQPDQKRFDLLLALGDAQWWAGQVPKASQTFQSAAFLARAMKDPHRLAEAALRVGEVGYGGVYMQAWSFDPLRVELLSEAVEALREEESLLKVRVMARLSTALYFSPFDSLSRRDSLSRASVELARRLGDPATLAYALNARHLAVWGPENLEERLMLVAEIVELAQQARDFSLELTGRVWRVADLLEQGDVSAADQEIEAYESLARRVGYPQFLANAFMLLAMQALLRGDFAKAEGLAMRSFELGERIGDVNVRLSHHVQMAVLRSLQGRGQETGAYLELVEREHPGELGRLVRMALLCRAGESSGVEEAFSSMWRAKDKIPPAFWLAVGVVGLTTLAAATRRSAEGAILYNVALPYERRWALAGRDAVACLGPVAFGLGVLAESLSRFDAAARHFEVALEEAERVGSRPYLALTQGAYGAMLARRGRSLDHKRAVQLLGDALKTARELGMNQLYDDVITAQARLTGGRLIEQPEPDAFYNDSHETGVFRREGEYWTVGFEGLVVLMKDAKGLGYLQRLLAAPDREFHVLDLAAGTSPPSARRAQSQVPEGYSIMGMDVGEVLDPAAKAAYRRRIDELRQDLEEAESHSDLERASRLRADIDFVVDELASAVGLGGRGRVSNSPGERARSAVTKSLRNTLQRIAQVHPTLGTHLLATVRTGYYCSYRPDPRAPVEWTT
jgi:tetratricopeptide (TPR) repeat protein